MSLKVWLPLIGDLKNLGNLNTNISSIETSPVWAEGKLGSCYQRATTSNQSTNGIKIDTNFLDVFSTEASVAMWVKPLGTHTHYNGTLLSSGNWNAKRWAFGVSQDNTKVDVLCGGYNTYITCSVPENEWTHLASTYNNGVSKLYKNGEYIGELTDRPAFNSDATWTGVGRETYAGGYFGFNGLINDVRIYDHCLSAAEVKEISQGLVLHYKLDSIKIQNGTNLVTGITAGGRTTKLTDGRIGVRTAGENNDTYFTANLSENIVKDTQYYLSCEASGISEGAYWGFRLGVSSSSSPFFKIYNGHNEYIFTANDINWGTNRLLFDDSNRPDWANKATFWDFQLIKLNDEETQLQILDSSGYKYHGMAIGLPILADASSLYSKAIYMNNTSSSNHIEINDIITLSDITVSFWLKASKSKPQVIFADAENSIEFGILNSLGYTKTTSTKGWTLKNFKDNDWNHIVVIRKNSVDSLFVNSILETQNGANNYYLHQATKTWLLNRSYNNSYAADASISDFRIYATALSQEDIQALYNVRARVDNLQNIHSYEFKESSSKELLQGIHLTTGYTNHTALSSKFTNYNNNQPYFNAKSASMGTPYIPINPTGHTYYYDFEISVNTGNQVYIGFERYDEQKTARSNNACTYVIITKPASDIEHKRYFGTVNLATDGVNPCAFIALRVLNGWPGTDSSVTPIMTIHRMSLREVSTLKNSEVLKTGVFSVDELNENNIAALYKNGMVEAAEFIEI